MREIPESVKEAARAAADAQGDYWKVGGTLETIERAILAERESCAKIAEERFTKENVLKTTKGVPYLTGGAAIYAATRIAAAIRRR